MTSDKCCLNCDWSTHETYQGYRRCIWYEDFSEEFIEESEDCDVFTPNVCFIGNPCGCCKHWEGLVE